MEIPYTVEPRPDTGLYNGKLGIWLFIASELMLFGALFSAYVLLRTAAPDWPTAGEVLDVPRATVNSFVLIASSITVVLAWRALGRSDLRAFRGWYGGTVLLGLVFLAIKGFEYADKVGHGLHPADSTFLAIYFTLTGAHALHVLGGVVVHAWLLGPGFGLWRREPDRYRNRIEVAGLYWHFVDLVWLVLFPSLYLL